MEQHSGRQYGEWLKAGGAMKNGGEKENNESAVRVERWSSPSPMVGGRAGEVDGGVSMMDEAPLDTVRGTFTSNHREQEKQIKWDNMGLVGLKIGLVQAACDEQKEVITDLVRNEVYGNEVVQVEVGKELGPVIKESEVLSPIKPKEKEDTSEERKV